MGDGQDAGRLHETHNSAKGDDPAARGIEDGVAVELQELRRKRDEAFERNFESRTGIPTPEDLRSICHPSVVRDELTVFQKRRLMAWKELAGDEIDIKPILRKHGPEADDRAWREIQFWAEEESLRHPDRESMSAEELGRFQNWEIDIKERNDDEHCFHDCLASPNTIPNAFAVNRVRDHLGRHPRLTLSHKELLFAWHGLSKVNIDPILMDHTGDSAGDAWNKLRLWADKNYFSPAEAGERQSIANGHSGSDDEADLGHVETGQAVPSGEESQPIADDRFLRLSVCDKSKTIARHSVAAVKVDLSAKPSRWSIFMPLFEAESNGTSPKALQKKYNGKDTSFNSTLSNLREDLQLLGVTISHAASGRYRLIDDC